MARHVQMTPQNGMKRHQFILAGIGLAVLFLAAYGAYSRNTASTMEFRQCVRMQKIVTGSPSKGYSCTLPDGSTVHSSDDRERDLPISSFDTANDMISGSNEREDRILDTPEKFEVTWQELFGQMDPSQVPEKPKMDARYFERSTVIALFAGQKNSGGYSIEPLMAWEEPDRIEIIVRETAPKGGAQTVMTTPYSIFSIPNKKKPIVFLHVTDEKKTEQSAPETRY